MGLAYNFSDSFCVFLAAFKIKFFNRQFRLFIFNLNRFSSGKTDAFNNGFGYDIPFKYRVYSQRKHNQKKEINSI